MLNAQNEPRVKSKSEAREKLNALGFRSPDHPIKTSPCYNLHLSLRLYNTLSGKVEEFTPSKDKMVRMYACGPTVYDYGHIGNFRTFVAIDVLRRFLRQSGNKLQHVMNITDVEDKIIRNAAHEHKTVQEYTPKYEDAFLEHMQTLITDRPHPLASQTHQLQA